MYEIRKDNPTENLHAARDREPAGARKQREPRAILAQWHGERAAIGKNQRRLQREPMKSFTDNMLTVLIPVCKIPQVVSVRPSRYLRLAYKFSSTNSRRDFPVGSSNQLLAR